MTNQEPRGEDPPDSDQPATVPPPPGPESAGSAAARPLGSRYLLDERIGSGATGQVWRGRRRDTREPVAVKLLSAEFSRNQQAVSRFLRQRTVLQHLDHPHLVQVHDLVAEGEVLAIVMELVAGEDLRRVVRRRALGGDQMRTLLAQVADALDAIHQAGIVHRDIKPENVLVRGPDTDPYALLTDFGLAGATAGPSDLTRRSQLLGTIPYMAPELAQGLPATAATDVYSLGVMAYELLAGGRPFTNENPYALLRAHVEDEPPRPPGLADPDWALVHSMLAKDPADRPAATAVAGELRRLGAAGPTSPAPEVQSPPGAAPDSTPDSAPDKLVPPDPPPAPRWRRPAIILTAMTLATLAIASQLGVWDPKAPQSDGSPSASATPTPTSASATPAPTSASATPAHADDSTPSPTAPDRSPSGLGPPALSSTDSPEPVTLYRYRVGSEAAFRLRLADDPDEGLFYPQDYGDAYRPDVVSDDLELITVYERLCDNGVCGVPEMFHYAPWQGEPQYPAGGSWNPPTAVFRCLANQQTGSSALVRMWNEDRQAWSFAIRDTFIWRERRGSGYEEVEDPVICYVWWPQ